MSYQRGHRNAGFRDGAPSRAGSERANQPSGKFGQQNWISSPRALWRRNRGDGQPFPGLQSDYAGREGGPNYRPLKQSNRNAHPTGESSSHQSARYASNDVNGPSGTCLWNSQLFLFDFLQGSAQYTSASSVRH